MNELDQQLSQLICHTCAHAKSSLERRNSLDQLIRQLMASGKLWRRADIPEADFQEILQKSWIYLCGNLCEATTAATPYDATRSSIFTWINAYIKMRVLDYRLDIERVKQQRATAKTMDDGNVLDPIELMPAPVDPPPMLQEVLAWVERDSSVLRRIYLRDRPDINGKTLILRRLPPHETSWKQLAQEFGVAETSLQGFYRQQCLPRLKDAGRELGYL
ncbi:MAG: sigma-70 family RNA polymerase sigma factor [Verrucomicrobia bacterium]|nr:sigma-70 family RNA polymerase sigma factor [Leptolyngbya sp. ES-bin-22]